MYILRIFTNSQKLEVTYVKQYCVVDALTKFQIDYVLHHEGVHIHVKLIDEAKANRLTHLYNRERCTMYYITSDYKYAVNRRDEAEPINASLKSRAV